MPKGLQISRNKETLYASFILLVRSLLCYIYIIFIYELHKNIYIKCRTKGNWAMPAYIKVDTINVHNNNNNVNNSDSQ